MRVGQFEISGSGRRVGVVDGNDVIDITAKSPSLTYVFQVFDAAQNSGVGFEHLLQEAAGASNSRLNYAELLGAPIGGDAPFLHAPVDHIDPHRVLIPGTGLTHPGGMESRDATPVAEDSEEAEAPLTAPAKLVPVGVEGGRPAAGGFGEERRGRHSRVRPEARAVGTFAEAEIELNLG